MTKWAVVKVLKSVKIQAQEIIKEENSDHSSLSDLTTDLYRQYIKSKTKSKSVKDNKIEDQ